MDVRHLELDHLQSWYGTCLTHGPSFPYLINEVLSYLHICICSLSLGFRRSSLRQGFECRWLIRKAQANQQKSGAVRQKEEGRDKGCDLRQHPQRPLELTCGWTGKHSSESPTHLSAEDPRRSHTNPLVSGWQTRGWGVRGEPLRTDTHILVGGSQLGHMKKWAHSSVSQSFLKSSP